MGARKEGKEVVFWVADTGMGLAKEDLPHVFDRFWQARKSQRGGAGLGLAIVSGIVQAHGGCLWSRASSAEGALSSSLPPAPEMPKAPTDRDSIRPLRVR